MNQPDRVNNIRTGCRANLPPTGLGVAGREFNIDLLDEVENRSSHRLGDRILFFLHSVGSGDTAAGLLGFLHCHPGDQTHEFYSRHTQTLRFELAGRVVGNGHVDAFHVHVELAAIVEVDEELTNVPGTRSNIFKFRGIHFQDVVSLMAKHSTTRTRRGDNRCVPIRLTQIMGQTRDILTRFVVKTI